LVNFGTFADSAGIIGNKCDLLNERKVGQDEVQKFASKIGVPYFEASAKSRINVVEAFEAVLRLMINHRKGGATTTSTYLNAHL